MADDWNALPLSDVLEPVKRPVRLEDSDSYRTLGVRWYGNGPFLKAAKRGSEIATKTLNQVEPGDVVYSKLFAWKGSFGVVPPECRGAVASSEFPTYRCDETILLPQFFQLWASRPDVWLAADDASTGTTAGSRNRLAPDDFLAFEIDLPPITIQQRIVEAIQRVERAEQALRREEAAASVAVEAAREALLVTTDSWEEVPDNWTVVQLEDVADIRSGITKGRKTNGALTPVPFIRAANVQDGYLDLTEIKTLTVSPDELKRFALEVDDVLMTEGGNAEHVGRGWLWQGQAANAICQNHVFRARPKANVIEPRFLAYAIGASPARAYCFESAKKTTNLASINKTQISAMPIPLPPVAAQRKIVAQLDQLRASRVGARKSASAASALRQSLTADLITGVRPVPQMVQ